MRLNFTKLVCCASTVISFLAAERCLAACTPSSTPSGYRFPIVLNPAPEMMGVSVDKFEAWSFGKGKWSQIALQIDEKNDEGSYVLEGGMPFTKGTDDGLTDRNDEISLRGTQLGESFSRSQVPIHIRDRLTAFQRLDVCVGSVYSGSVLIGWGRDKVARLNWAPLFNEISKTVVTPAYRYVFNRPRPMLVGEVFLKSQGKEFPVFADSIFMMPIVPRFWMLPGTRFDETDFTSEIECWRSGPVRSIVAVGAKMNKFFSIVKLHLFSELIFYDDFFQIPTEIEMIFNASRFLTYGSGLAYILRYPEGGTWTLSSNLVELPKSSDLGAGSADGHPLQTARQASPEGVFRAVGTRPEGSFLAQVRVDPKAIDVVPPPFIIPEGFFDKEPWRSEWSWLKGTKGNLGVFLDISAVPKGVYDFALDLMLSDRANDGFTDFRPVTWAWQTP